VRLGTQRDRADSADRRGVVEARGANAGGVRTALLLPAAVFCLLAVGLLWPALPGGGEVLGGDDQLLFLPPFDSVRPADVLRPSNSFEFDSTYVFHPDQLFARELIRQGELPTWNNLTGAGQPLLAQQQTAPLYPGTLITFLLPYWESLGLVAALKLVIAALGTYLFGRALGLGRLAAVLSGTAFAFGTYMVSWLEHPHSNAYILLPWLMLLVERLMKRARLGDALALGCVGGLALLAGHPQSALIIALPASVLAAFRLGNSRRADGTSVSRPRVLALLVAALVLSLLLGAVMVLPFAEVVGQSYNIDRPNSPLAWNGIYGFFFPEFWGRPDKFQLLGGPKNYPERTMYVGALSTALALAGLVARRPSGDQIFFAVLGGVTLLALFDTPLFDVVLNLPGVHSIIFLRLLIVVSLCGAMLAGFGLQVLLDGDLLQRKRALAAFLLVALIAPIPWVLQQGVPLGELGTALRELPDLGMEPQSAPVVEFAAVMRWLLLMLIGALLILVAIRFPRATLVTMATVVAIVALELVSLNRGYNPAVEKSWVDPPLPTSVRYLQRVQGHGRIAADGEVLGPNTASRYGLRDARTHALPVVERYSRLWNALGGTGFQRTLLNPDANVASRAVDVFGVSYVLAPGRPVGMGTAGPVPFVGQGGPVVRNPDALPRAYVAYGWQRVGDLPTAVAAIAALDAKRIRDFPLVEDLPSRPSPGDATPARIVTDTASEVSVRVRARRPGLLVLHDTYFPGWRAYVDRDETRIHPANGAFRAVRVPAGEHTVRFAYEPTSVRVGLLLSGLGVLLALGGGVALGIRRRSMKRS
jgi:hypothetical protein